MNTEEPWSQLSWISLKVNKYVWGVKYLMVKGVLAAIEITLTVSAFSRLQEEQSPTSWGRTGRKICA